MDSLKKSWPHILLSIAAWGLFFAVDIMYRLGWMMGLVIVAISVVLNVHKKKTFLHSSLTVMSAVSLILFIVDIYMGKITIS